MSITTGTEYGKTDRNAMPNPCSTEISLMSGRQEVAEGGTGNQWTYRECKKCQCGADGGGAGTIQPRRRSVQKNSPLGTVTGFEPAHELGQFFRPPLYQLRPTQCPVSCQNNTKFSKRAQPKCGDGRSLKNKSCFNPCSTGIPLLRSGRATRRAK